MKFEKGGSMRTGLNVMRFAAKMRRKKQAAAEEAAKAKPSPSLAGGMMAIRFAAKAKNRIAEARALRAKDGHNKRETVSVDKQVSLLKGSLSQLDAETDIHTIVSAFNAARYLSQKHAGETNEVATVAQDLEQKLRTENPELAKKLDLRGAPKIKAMVRRMWDLLLVESTWYVKLKAVLQAKSDEVVQKEGWAALFKLMDQDGSGSLDVEEFVQAVRESGVQPEDITDNDLKRTFQAVDDDGSGEIDGEELAGWLIGLEREVEEARFQKQELPGSTQALMACMIAIRDASAECVAVLGWEKLFARFDEDGSGGLDSEEFTDVVRSCGIGKAEATDEDLHSVFQLIDDDESGAISAAELAEALCKDSTKRLDTSSISSVPEVTLQAYTRFHCCLGKALTEYGAEDWSVEEAEEVALMDWTEDVARFSNDATINSWFVKVKNVLQAKSEEVVQKEGWAALFKSLDQDGSGSLDVDEFMQAIRQSGVRRDDISDFDLKRTFQAVDDDGSGEIDGEELAAWLIGLAGEETRAEERGKQLPKAKQALIRCMNAIRDASAEKVSIYGWKKLFDKFDEDGSGGLDCEEFTTAVRAESGLTVEDVSDEDMREIFAMIDDDGSGAISATEFAECLCKDESENYKMTYDAFERSMFELVDHWADGVSEPAYIAFFSALFRSIVIKMTGVDGYDAPVLKTSIRQGGESNYILKEPEDVVASVTEDGKFDLGSDALPDPEPEPEPEPVKKPKKKKSKPKEPEPKPVEKEEPADDGEDAEVGTAPSLELPLLDEQTDAGHRKAFPLSKTVGHYSSSPMVYHPSTLESALPMLGAATVRSKSSPRFLGARGGGFRDEYYRTQQRQLLAKSGKPRRGAVPPPEQGQHSPRHSPIDVVLKPSPPPPRRTASTQQGVEGIPISPRWYQPTSPKGQQMLDEMSSPSAPIAGSPETFRLRLPGLGASVRVMLDEPLSSQAASPRAMKAARPHPVKPLNLAKPAPAATAGEGAAAAAAAAAVAGISIDLSPVLSPVQSPKAASPKRQHEASTAGGFRVWMPSTLSGRPVRPR